MAETIAVATAPYGSMPDGRPVRQFTLENRRGMRARIIEYGAILAWLEVGDRDGRRQNVVLGAADLAGYLADRSHLGTVAGRYANRIAGARFELDGVTHLLDSNVPPDTLHGGERGFGRVLWQGTPVGDNGVALRYRSPDGEQGFPGMLDTVVRYTVGEDDALTIEFSATTDCPTVVNLTNHSYFNLAGEGSGDIYDHEITILADAFTPMRAGLLPTGEIRAVDGTPFDLRAPTAIGARIRMSDPQLLLARGFDHNFVLRDPGMLRLAARLKDPASGRVLEVLTTESGLQFYSGNFLDGTRAGTSGRPYRQSDGLCLETQHFPNSPNQPAFPPTVLRPGQEFRSMTVFHLRVD